MKLYSFPKGLKKARKKAGIRTQQELADLLGVSLRTVQNWEQGLAAPNFEMLETISEKLNCDYDYLFDRLEVPTHELQFVCDYTGLSEKAISEIAMLFNEQKQHKEYYPAIETLSRLIEHPDFEKVLGEIYMSCIHFDRQIPKDSIPDEFDEKEVIEATRRFTISQIKQSPINYPEYNASRSSASAVLQNIIDDICCDGMIERQLGK